MMHTLLALALSMAPLTHSRAILANDIGIETMGNKDTPFAADPFGYIGRRNGNNILGNLDNMSPWTVNPFDPINGGEATWKALGWQPYHEGGKFNFYDPMDVGQRIGLPSWLLGVVGDVIGAYTGNPYVAIGANAAAGAQEGGTRGGNLGLLGSIGGSFAGDALGNALAGSSGGTAGIPGGSNVGSAFSGGVPTGQGALSGLNVLGSSIGSTVERAVAAPVGAALSAAGSSIGSGFGTLAPAAESQGGSFGMATSTDPGITVTGNPSASGATPGGITPGATPGTPAKDTPDQAERRKLGNDLGHEAANIVGKALAPNVGATPGGGGGGSFVRPASGGGGIGGVGAAGLANAGALKPKIYPWAQATSTT